MDSTNIYAYLTWVENEWILKDASNTYIAYHLCEKRTGIVENILVIFFHRRNYILSYVKFKCGNEKIGIKNFKCFSRTFLAFQGRTSSLFSTSFQTILVFATL